MNQKCYTEIDGYYYTCTAIAFIENIEDALHTKHHTKNIKFDYIADFAKKRRWWRCYLKKCIQ